MKNIWKAFMQYLTQIRHDAMLAAVLVSPILMGLLFRLGVPPLEQSLCRTFAADAFLSPYYLLFDLLLAVMTPMLFTYSGVMVILEEADCGLSAYLMVTPLGRRGYLVSRLGLPAVFAALFNLLVLSVFNLSGPDLGMMLCLSALCALFGIVTSLLVVSIASNKVEGMAVTKLSGMLVLGLPVVFFVHGPVQYLAGILPTFWLARLSLSWGPIDFLLAAAVSLLWIALLYRRFLQKLA